MGENNVVKRNLLEMAKHHVITKTFSLLGKKLSLTYYIVACHKFDGKDVDGGTDWFYVQQHGILNGGDGYQKKWAGTRIGINGESWYVGEGEVCLNYVDYYRMKNYFPLENGECNQAELIFVEPEAINNLTTYSVAESISIGGNTGFEVGDETGGSGTFSAESGFEMSYSFEVQDCSCEGMSLAQNNTSAEWEYSFKRASQNRAAGKWQRLHDPAVLSHSVFSPINTWIWKIPSNKRQQYNEFVSEFELGIMNTISRYSGSQSPKNIPKSASNDERKVSFRIPLTMPPLLAVDKNSILFSEDAQTKRLYVAAQGNWDISVKDRDDTWISLDCTEGVGERSVVYVTVEKYTGNKTRVGYLQIKRRDCIEEIEVKIVQSVGLVE